MKTLRFFVTGLFFTIVFALSIPAQTRPQTAAPPSSSATAPQSATKIAVINTNAFDATDGITKYVNARVSLQKEFETVNAELKVMGTRYDILYKEIQSLRAQASKPGGTANPATLQAKMDEYGKLERDIKFKQENAKARSQTRYNAVMSPILQDIGKAIQEYSKQKGYTMILDVAKLQVTGLLLAVGDMKVDVTKDFIVFYNSRPAGAGNAAGTGTPK